MKHLARAAPSLRGGQRARPVDETYLSFRSNLLEHLRALWNGGRAVLKHVEKCASGAARICRTEHMCQRLNVAGRLASSEYIAPHADVRVAEGSRAHSSDLRTFASQMP